MKQRQVLTYSEISIINYFTVYLLKLTASIDYKKIKI